MQQEGEVRVVFVRHGETDWNRASMMQGVTNTPLNAVGESQAAAAASALSQDHFDVIASSTLRRAAATADAIASYHPGTPRVCLEGFMEMRFGELEGKVIIGDSEWARKFQRLYDLWDCGKGDDEAAVGGETPAEVRARMTATLNQVINSVPAKGAAAPRTVAVVAHGRCLRILVSSLLGLPLSKVPMDNTSLSTLRRTADGRWEAVRLNDTTHVTASNIPLFSVAERQKKAHDIKDHVQH
eukprot:m51a1_g9154 hypothetical protein (241) ;mRNA; f:124335-125164